MFKITSTTLGSAVVSGGTITFSYPDNTSAGNFANYGHKLWVDKHQKLYLQPASFTVSLGASNITVTYNGTTSIPTGAQVKLEVGIEGSDDGDSVTSIDETVNNTVLGEVVRVDLGSADAADTNGFCVSQNLTAAGVFSVSVTAAAAIAAGALGGIADVARNVVAAWTGTAVLTVTGTDEYGKVLVESSASGTTFTGLKTFKTVTGISVSSNVTSLTVGTGVNLGLPLFVGDAGSIIAEYEGGTQLVRNNGKMYLQGHMLEAAVDAGTSLELVSPVAGNIKKVTTVARGTITTGGAITVEVGGTLVNGLSVTIANSASAGDVDSDTPTAGHATTAVAVGDRIEIIPASAFNGSADIFVIVEIELDSAEQLSGTFVAGSTVAATALTGDVRGTYTPFTTPDGGTAESLFLLTTDPKYLGLAQYAG